MRNMFLCCGLAACLALVSASPRLTANSYFSRKTITVLVGYSAGGPVDNFARLVAAHIGAHVPGTPTVIVQNMPGADGVAAANYLYNVAPKDGTEFLIEVAPFTDQYIGGYHVKFDAGNFYWLGALNYSNVIYARSDLGIKSPSDIVNFHKQIIIGGLAPNASRDLYMKTFLESLEYRHYAYVTGYPGTLDIRNALLRNEVNFSTEAVVSVVTDLASYVRSGSIISLVQSGLSRDGRSVRDPQLPNVPMAEEAVIAVRGNEVRNAIAFRAMNLVISMFAAGRAIVMPPGIDPAIGGALRKAFGELNTDSSFEQSAANLNGGAKMELTDGETAQTLAADVLRLVKTDPAALKYLEDMSEERANH